MPSFWKSPLITIRDLYNSSVLSGRYILYTLGCPGGTEDSSITSAKSNSVRAFISLSSEARHLYAWRWFAGSTARSFIGSMFARNTRVEGVSAFYINNCESLRTVCFPNSARRRLLRSTLWFLCFSVTARPRCVRSTLTIITAAFAFAFAALLLLCCCCATGVCALTCIFLYIFYADLIFYFPHFLYLLYYRAFWVRRGKRSTV